jgi:hypothetical protein
MNPAAAITIHVLFFLLPSAAVADHYAGKLAGLGPTDPLAAALAAGSSIGCRQLPSTTCLRC